MNECDIRLFNCSAKRVVPAVQPGIDDIDARVPGVHAVLADIDGSCVGAGLVAVGIVDPVGDGRTRSADVDVLHRGEVEAAAPDVRSGDGHILASSCRSIAMSACSV